MICAFRRNRKCRISANNHRFYSYTPPMSHNSKQFLESCKGYHGPSTDLNCITVKIIAKNMFGPVEQAWNCGTGTAVNQPHVRSAFFPLTLFISSGCLAAQFG
ncbi:hypothetical protein T4B_11599 [Trichinella pseudospiralis]|uniref:Uncharacterized protein n=1 Tax=Trichinella pseudospiralis TaxID=6337 RepID=A0A0V1IXY6_TRIPS|nr:hypothetical protein T4B_11599 [Trichinella pseudospiralis]